MSGRQRSRWTLERIVAGGGESNSSWSISKRKTRTSGYNPIRFPNQLAIPGLVQLMKCWVSEGPCGVKNWGNCNMQCLETVSL